MVHPVRSLTPLWFATVVLVTLNLRPFLTAIGPLAPAIQTQTGMSLQQLSWLTLLPMALMGAGTWLAPGVLHRLGARTAMTVALLLIALGCLARQAGAWPGVLVGTAAACGAGVAIAQGLLPGLIKLLSPRHVTMMMGVYSASLMGGGALAAQLSPMTMDWGLSWQSALAIWAWPVVAGLVLAWRQLDPSSLPAIGGGPGDGATRWLLRRRRTWLLMLIFGLMNGGYAIMVAWLAPYYQALGWSAARSGWLVAVLSVAQVVAALAMPVLARRGLDRRPGFLLMLACQVAGFAILAWWPLALPVTGAVVLGVGLGGGFMLIMLLALDHLHDPIQAGTLNALMQGGGFILAALAPWAMAGLHGLSGSFVSGWVMQLFTVLVVAALALQLAPRDFARVMRVPEAG